MSDDPPDSIERQVEDLEIRKSQRRVERSDSDEDRYIALAAVDLNGGNVYRIAVALYSRFDPERMGESSPCPR